MGAPRRYAATRADNVGHAAYVEAWFHRAAHRAEPPSPDELVSLFERAIAALSQRAQVTLGEVTLAAIIDRVLYTAAEAHAVVSTLKNDGAEVSFALLREQTCLPGDLSVAVRFILVEFITVIGNLTDEILTPALQAALSQVTLDEPDRAGHGDAKGARR